MLAGVALLGEQQLPWASKLRRMNAGSPTQAEWLAPDSVMRQVRDDYKRAMRWLQDVALQSDAVQLANADADYLTGEMLKDHTERINRYRTRPKPLCGVLRATTSWACATSARTASGASLSMYRLSGVWPLTTAQRVSASARSTWTTPPWFIKCSTTESPPAGKLRRLYRFCRPRGSTGTCPGRVRLQPELNTTAGRDY